MDEVSQMSLASPEQQFVTSDEVLIGRLRSGEAIAGDDLVRRYCGPLMAYLHRLTGSPQAAEELHQQTWVSVLEHLERFDDGTGPGSFRAWLFRIATNKANDWWRSQGRSRKLQDGLKRVAEESTPDASARAEGTEMNEKVRKALDQLPEAQRQVVCLRYYSNLKFVEIAEVLGCPLNTALGRMHRAITRLRRLLES